METERAAVMFAKLKLIKLLTVAVFQTKLCKKECAKTKRQLPIINITSQIIQKTLQFVTRNNSQIAEMGSLYLISELILKFSTRQKVTWFMIYVLKLIFHF